MLLANRLKAAFEGNIMQVVDMGQQQAVLKASFTFTLTDVPAGTLIIQTSAGHTPTPGTPTITIGGASPDYTTASNGTNVQTNMATKYYSTAQASVEVIVTWPANVTRASIQAISCVNKNLGTPDLVSVTGGGTETTRSSTMTITNPRTLTVFFGYGAGGAANVTVGGTTPRGGKITYTAANNDSHLVWDYPLNSANSPWVVTVVDIRSHRMVLWEL